VSRGGRSWRGRGLLRKLGGAREANDATSPQRVCRPGELLGRQDRRKLHDAWSGAGDSKAGRVLHVLVQVAAVNAEEGDQLPDGALERRVETGGIDVNELPRELGEERLEPQAALEEPLRAPARRPVKQEPHDQRRLDEDQEHRSTTV